MTAEPVAEARVAGKPTGGARGGNGGLDRLLSRRSFGTLASAALASSILPATAQTTPPLLGPVEVAVDATVIGSFEARDPQRRVFGALEFRGGLALTSRYAHFGGLSALRIERGGARFLAVTDRGSWLRGRIVYENDAPRAVADAEMAPILGADGAPLRARRWYDAESLAEQAGTVWVGYERVHGIVRFDYAKHGLAARGQPIAVPPRLKQLSANKGIEGLLAVPPGFPLGGALLAVAERGIAGVEGSIGFIIGGPAPGEFRLEPSEDFDVTDLALTPGGEVLILERYFSFFRGLRVRIRGVPLAEIRPGAAVKGRVLWQSDMGHEIDNMEGLAVHATPSGEVVLTLVSDDNFSSFQRTLLLQFTLGDA